MQKSLKRRVREDLVLNFIGDLHIFNGISMNSYSTGIKLLDFCYRQDADKAQRLLTCELHSWSSQSCLSLAVAANHRALLAHPCSQVILADLWMGGLRTRKNTNFKVSENL